MMISLEGTTQNKIHRWEKIYISRVYTVCLLVTMQLTFKDMARAMGSTLIPSVRLVVVTTALRMVFILFPH